MSIRSPNSLKDELDVLLKETDDEGRKCAESGSGKDFRKHQYFLSSEEGETLSTLYKTIQLF